jgi:predicted RNA-binding protein with PIN domain
VAANRESFSDQQDEGSRSRGAWSRFAREVATAFAIGSAFVTAGLAWAAVASELQTRGEVRAPIAYAPPPMTSREPTIWLVDGYNVLHAAVLGGKDRSQWWTGARRRELLERVAGFDANAEVWIVFDGPDDAGPESAAAGPRCVFAASADDWLVDRVRRAEDPAEIAVVTADRQVAGRAQGRGARVVSPKEFLARCAT